MKYKQRCQAAVQSAAKSYTGLLMNALSAIRRFDEIALSRIIDEEAVLVLILHYKTLTMPDNAWSFITANSIRDKVVTYY